MSRILFLTDFYYPNPTSIGTCVEKIAREMKNRGHEVHVLCFGNKKMDVVDNEGITIHFVKKRFWDRCEDYANEKKKFWKFSRFIGRFSIRFSQIIHFFSYPYISFVITQRYSRVSLSLMKKYRFDTVISSYAPMEAMVSGYNIKKKYQNVYWILYILDTLTNRGDSKFLSSNMNDRLGWKWEKKFYRAANLIINMKCHEKHHQKKRYDLFRDKLKFSDIPLLDDCCIKMSSRDSDKVVFAYTGRISEKYYSPVYWLKCLNRMHEENIDFEMNLCGSTDCESFLAEYSVKTCNKIKYKGLLSQDSAKIEREKADILINFGALNSEKIHSKIFEYISLKKKIIHIQRCNIDSSVEYFEKYPLALIIKEWEDFDSNYNKIMEFIKFETKFCDWENVFGLYQMNFPEYTCDLIENGVNKKQ